MSRYAPAGASDQDSNSEDDYFEFFDQSENKILSNVNVTTDNTKHDYDKSTVNVFLSKQKLDETTSKNSLLLHDLQTSSIYGDVQSVIRLVKELGDPNVPLNSGWTALMYAAYFAQVDVVKALIKIGASVEVVNRENMNALHATCKSNAKTHVVQLGEIAKELLSTGVDVLAVDTKGRTPLMYASRGGLLDIVKIFVGLDTMPRNMLLTDDRGWTAADCAAAYGHLDILICLIDSGAVLNSSSFSFKVWPKLIVDYICSKQQSYTEEKVEECFPISIVTLQSNEDFSSCPSFEVIENKSINNADSCNENFKTDITNENMKENDHKVSESSTSLEKDLNVVDNSRQFSVMSNQESDGQNLAEITNTELHETINIPALFIREQLSSEEYETYGQLELFLLGLDLARLIPIFKEHDIVFEQLLCLTNDDLLTIGISALGTRKRIMTAISECHLKHTNSSDLLDYTTTALTFEKMMTLISGASEQVAYIASCMRYINHHIKMYPDALEAKGNTSYDTPPIECFKEKVEDMTKSLFSLSKAIKCVKLQTSRIVKTTPTSQLIPPDMVCDSNDVNSSTGNQVWIIVGLSLLYAAVSYGHIAVNWF